MKNQGHGSHWETVLGEENIFTKLKEILLNSDVLSKKKDRCCHGYRPRRKGYVYTYMSYIKSPFEFHDNLC